MGLLKLSYRRRSNPCLTSYSSNSPVWNSLRHQSINTRRNEKMAIIDFQPAELCRGRYGGWRHACKLSIFILHAIRTFKWYVCSSVTNAWWLQREATSLVYFALSVHHLMVPFLTSLLQQHFWIKFYEKFQRTLRRWQWKNRIHWFDLWQWLLRYWPNTHLHQSFCYRYGHS